MKRGEVFFHPMEGSGQLSISWSSGSKGAAVEAEKGNGVGFFSTQGDLLSVIFDDVSAGEDHQTLEFKKYRIEIIVRDGVVTHKVTQSIRPRSIRAAKKTTRPALKRQRRKIKR
ncbi:MAG TPA: hypothetical protein VLE95_07205 [Chlamydiales bacterium]|nr:hypothetical protein [Chlamydiales bacterium]